MYLHSPRKLLPLSEKLLVEDLQTHKVSVLDSPQKIPLPQNTNVGKLLAVTVASKELHNSPHGEPSLPCFDPDSHFFPLLHLVCEVLVEEKTANIHSPYNLLYTDLCHISPPSLLSG